MHQEKVHMENLMYKGFNCQPNINVKQKYFAGIGQK